MTGIAIPVGGISLVTVGPLLLPAVGGATIVSGAGVHRDIADDLELKELDVTDILTADALGILLNDTTNGAGAVVVPSGVRLTGWSGLTLWDWFAFDTGGSLTNDPATDLASGEFVTWAGFAISTTDIFTQIVPTGVAI